MKKIVFILSVLLSFSALAQTEISEGIITSKQTMSSDNPQAQAQLAMIGDVITTTYFNDSASRSETSSPMMGSNITIMDMKTQDMIVFIDNPMMGKKYNQKNFKEENKEAESVTVTKGEATKTILGYGCQQYEVSTTVNGAVLKMDLYVTDKIKTENQQLVSSNVRIEGYPLYMEMKINQQGMSLVITNEVTEIKEDTISADKFDMTPLEGYEKTENLMGM